MATNPLTYLFDGQETGFWCGPASVQIALRCRGIAKTEAELAKTLGTTTFGTSSSADVVRVLNQLLGAGTYDDVYIPGKTATDADVAALKTALVRSVDAGFAVVANVVGTIRPISGGSFSYPGGHYVAVTGYRAGGDEAYVADVGAPAQYWVRTSALAVWIAERGYSYLAGGDMRLLWLPDALRAAGLTVNLYDGWEARGASTWGPLRGVVCHATAGSRLSTDASETRTLWVTGSTSAPAPISQLYLSRSGEWWVGASGRCNHVTAGDQGPHKGFGNSSLIGVEAQNDNRGEAWTDAMLDSYQRGVAAICRRMGWPASVVVAHREHQTDKTDPVGIDMVVFRGKVAAILNGDDDMAQVQVLVRQPVRAGGDDMIWISDGQTRWPISKDERSKELQEVRNAHGAAPNLLPPLANGGKITDTGDIRAWGWDLSTVSGGGPIPGGPFDVSKASVAEIAAASGKAAASEIRADPEQDGKDT